MEIRDSRRLTGPNILWDRLGAALEIYGPEAEVRAVTVAWRGHVVEMLDAVGWNQEGAACQAFKGGCRLAISAPVDALYAATEVNEWAVDAAFAEVKGREGPDFKETLSRLREEIEREQNPSMMAMKEAASAHGVTFLSDDDYVSIGLGKGSRTFSSGRIPDPGSIDWTSIHDIPVAMITGTNGKSTTVRLVASMLRSAGLREGFSSTDGVVIDGMTAESGDFSGPEGARMVLRNEQVEAAVLEIARGGILRRGLPLGKADVVLVTNVAEDHLGEYGVNDLTSMVDAKLVVRRAVGAKGCLVLNADDANLRERGRDTGVPVAWFSLDIDRAGILPHVTAGGEAAWLEGGVLVWFREGRKSPILSVEEIPIAAGGIARYNVANAMAAMLVGGHLGLGDDALAGGLRSFSGTSDENPGRGNVFEINGVTAIVDFAHNAHGFRALFETAEGIPAARRLVILGQAGDRSDSSIMEQVRVTWEAGFDRIIIKEMEAYLRGRKKGEVPRLIESELRRLGATSGQIGRAGCEIDAVRQALRWSRPGDLLLLLVYAERSETFDLLNRLRDSRWRPGDQLTF